LEKKRYEQVADELKQMVSEMSGNDKLPSIRALMQQFNVSQVTLNRSLSILETGASIRRRSGKGYYVSEKRAGLKTRSHIAFVFCYRQEHMSNPLYGAMIARFLQKMTSTDDVLEIFACDEMKDIAKFRESFSEKKFDKCILMGCSKQSFLYALHDMAVDIVQIYPNTFTENDAVVQIDNNTIIEQLVEHLTGLGHSRITMVHGQGFEHVNMLDQEERMEAFYRAIEKRGLAYSARSMVYGGFNVETGYQAGLRILDTLPELRPTAIIANDYCAGGIYRAANELGLRIPEDISIAGIDNLPLCQCFSPQLTSVDINWPMAVDIAFDWVIHGIAESEVRLIPTNLIVRGSTGKCPAPAK